MKPTAIAELSKIWSENGCLEAALAAKTVLWHCGRIPRQLDINNDRMLWTTLNEEHCDHYAGSARECTSSTLLAPTMLTLSVQSNLRAADFNCASLVEFTVNHCNFQHEVMKATLRAWCVENDFGAVVRINRGEHEVAIVSPAADLKVLNAVPL